MKLLRLLPVLFATAIVTMFFLAQQKSNKALRMLSRQTARPIPKKGLNHSSLPRVSTKSKLWFKKDQFKYDAVASIIDAFDAVGINSFLHSGSVLGAFRNHGWFSWDKDCDLIVLTTDNNVVTSVLKSINLVPRATSFGFAVDLPTSEKDGKFGTTPYIDVWMYEVNGNNLKCVGNKKEGGCTSWCRDVNDWLECSDFSIEWYYPPIFVPFGPYLLPAPRKDYLDYYFGETWRTKCGGHQCFLGWICWYSGDCSQYYNSDIFVFSSIDEKNNMIEIGKKGGVVKHTFAVKNGVYTLAR
jgi:hypothetical protein